MRIKGTYYLWINDVIVYIGHTKDIRSRFFTHFESPWNLQKIDYDSITHFSFNNNYDLEKEEIIKYKPKFNKQFNDSFIIDKTISDDERRINLEALKNYRRFF